MKGAKSCGGSQAYVAKHLNLSIAFVKRWWNRKDIKRRPAGRPPKKITPRVERTIKTRLISKNVRLPGLLPKT